MRTHAFGLEICEPTTEMLTFAQSGGMSPLCCALPSEPLSLAYLRFEASLSAHVQVLMSIRPLPTPFVHSIRAAAPQTRFTRSVPARPRAQPCPHVACSRASPSIQASFSLSCASVVEIALALRWISLFALSRIVLQAHFCSRLLAIPSLFRFVSSSTQSQLSGSVWRVFVARCCRLSHLLISTSSSLSQAPLLSAASVVRWLRLQRACVHACRFDGCIMRASSAHALGG